MMNNRQIFLQHIGQTSPEPMELEIVKAKGNKLWDANGKEYIDLIGGVSVCNIGHGNRHVTCRSGTIRKIYACDGQW